MFRCGKKVRFLIPLTPWWMIWLEGLIEAVLNLNWGMQVMGLVYLEFRPKTTR